MCIFGNIFLVGNQYYCITIAVYGIQHGHNLNGCFGIKVTGRFVGKDDGRIVNQCAGNGRGLSEPRGTGTPKLLRTALPWYSWMFIVAPELG